MKGSINNKSNAKHNQIIGALDIGNSSVICLIGEVDVYNNLKVLSIAQRSTHGIIREGYLYDVKLLKDMVSDVIKDAEKEALTIAQKLHVTVSGSRVRSFFLSESRSIFGEEVTEYELEDLIQRASRAFKKNNPHYQKILVKINQCLIDSQHRVKSPIGVKADHLMIEVCIIAIHKSLHDNLVKIIDSTMHTVERFVLSSYASAYGCLSIEERLNTSTVIDIGEYNSSVIIFHADRMIDSINIPVGGKLITDDIKIVFDLSSDYAENIKILHGNLLRNYDTHDLIEALDYDFIQENATYKKTISLAELNAVIKDRVEEIFMLIAKKIESQESLHKYFSSNRNIIYLTGGTSSILGVDIVVGKLWKKNVFIKSTIKIDSHHQVLSDPIYSTVVGSLLIAYRGILGKRSKKRGAISYLVRFINRISFHNPIFNFFRGNI